MLLRPFIRHVVCTKSVLNPYASCSVHEMYHDLSDDLSMLVFCFRGQTFVDNFIYELQKSTTIAFSRNSLYTFFPRNPTCGIHQCLRISNRKYPPMPSEFHNREPPLPFGNPKSRPWYGMDIFWNRPIILHPTPSFPLTLEPWNHEIFSMETGAQTKILILAKCNSKD